MTRLRVFVAALLLAGGLAVGVTADAEPAEAAVIYTFFCGNYDRWGHISTVSSANPTYARQTCFNNLNAMEACIDWVAYSYMSGASYVYIGGHYDYKWWCGTGYHTLGGAFQ